MSDANTAAQRAAAAAAMNASAAASGSDYKAVVVLMLSGGPDWHHTLVSADATKFAQYSAGRGAAAQPLSYFTALTGGMAGYKLHPNLPNVAALLNTSRGAALANVGVLLQPLTRAQYLADVAASRSLSPNNLFSHNDQQAEGWTADPKKQFFNSGAFARAADLLRPAFQPSATIPLITTMQRAVVFGQGLVDTQYQTTVGGPINARTDPYLTAGVDALVRANIRDLSNTNLHRVELAKSAGLAFDCYGGLSAALTAVGPPVTVFPTSNIGKQLRMVAWHIKARAHVGLGPNRRRDFFYVDTSPDGSWDTHASISAHAAMLSIKDAAIKAFMDEMALQGAATDNAVTLITQSDFGRNLVPNNSGTDHGWGGHAFVFGGSVVGNQVYGTWPDLTLGGPNDAEGTGRLIPTLSHDTVQSTLCQWMGVPDAVTNGVNPIKLVLPNIDNFPTRRLGFLP